MSIEKLLEDRGATYGSYYDNAGLTEAWLSIAEKTPAWRSLPPTMKYAFRVIFMKLARTLSGDIYHADNWEDITGYASLVTKTLKGE